MPASSILLLDSDTPSAEVITGVLTKVGYAVSRAADVDAVFLQTPGDHHLVIIDQVADSRSASDICREIRATPALAAIPVLCISQTDEVEERIRFLEAGADDVMAKPFDARELEARVEALLLRFQRTRDLSPVVASGGNGGRSRRIVACFSPKGGVGTTTIAVNMATVIAQRKPDQALLIDLDLQFGDVATHLDLTPRQTIADLTRDDQALREPELLRSYVTRHESGLQVLAAPGSPELADLVTADHLELLLRTAQTAYDSVIVDGGSLLDERSLVLFSLAESVVLPVYPEIAALKGLHSLLDYLNEVGSVSAKATFVLNNVFAREILKMRDVESALGAKVAVELPYDPFLYQKAVNEGIPVVRGAAKSPVAEHMFKLAAAVFPPDGTAPAITQEERKRRLGGLLKRA